MKYYVEYCLIQTTAQPRNYWAYQLSSEYQVEVGGYWKRFVKEQLTIDLLTVKVRIKTVKIIFLIYWWVPLMYGLLR